MSGRRGPTADRGPARRRVLLGAATLATTGVAGCLDVFGGGGEEGCGPAEVTLDPPDGSTRCVTAVERDQSVAEFYGFDEDGNRSATMPDAFTANDATVTFLYRDTSAGELSLVVVNGESGTEAAAAGVAPVTFRGVEGYEWQVQDGPPNAVPYSTPSGAFGDAETALWNWPANRTDGGAVGPLDETFDVEVVHRAEATVDGTTMRRTGLDRWLFVDGSDPESPVELATFDGDTGDVSVRLSADSGE